MFLQLADNTMGMKSFHMCLAVIAAVMLCSISENSAANLDRLRRDVNDAMAADVTSAGKR